MSVKIKGEEVYSIKLNEFFILNNKEKILNYLESLKRDFKPYKGAKKNGV